MLRPGSELQQNRTWSVLVTGAGASVDLGEGGRRLPGMSDWAGEILDEGGPAAAALGLTRSMDGHEFEQALGEFLRAQAALVHARRLLALEPSAEASTWFDSVQDASERFADVVYSGVGRLFQPSRVSPELAERAYRPIVSALTTADPDSQLAYATTNYDLAGEIALERLGLQPHWGEANSTGGAAPRRILFDHTIDCRSFEVPVLHLHGAVGWYFAADGDAVVSTAPDFDYRKQLGNPAVALPDLNKAYRDPLSQSMWGQFEELITNAARVTVLGHRLNDRLLVRQLARTPPNCLGVLVNVRGDEIEPDSFGLRCNQIEAQLGFRPHLIPCKFGPEVRVGIQEWSLFLERESPKDELLAEQLSVLT